MLTTTCPACLTTHRVSEAQLGMRQGLVRCRHCALVFNAHDMLREGAEDAALPEPEDFPPQIDPWAGPSPARVGAPPLRDSLLATEDTLSKDLSTDPPIDMSEDRPEGGPPARSVGSWLAFVALLLLLAAQVALIERSTLQRHLPGLYAALVRVCAPLGCLTQPARLADAVEIKGSALDALAGERVRLSVTLANRGPLDLAWPHLVLTLQDAQGERLAVRALAPIDYLPPEAAPLLMARAEVEWRVLLGLGDARPVGYTLAVYYP